MIKVGILKKYSRLVVRSLFSFLLCFALSCEKSPDSSKPQLTQADAEAFLHEAEGRFVEASRFLNHASWLAMNFIGLDSQYVEARATREATLVSVQYAKRAAVFDDVELDELTRRKLNKLKMLLVLVQSTET